MINKLFILFAAGTANDDFSPLSSVPLTFSTGSSDGEEICTSLMTFADDLIECEEEFTVTTAVSAVGCNLFLVNNSTVVTLIETSGMYEPILQVITEMK